LLYKVKQLMRQLLFNYQNRSGKRSSNKLMRYQNDRHYPMRIPIRKSTLKPSFSTGDFIAPPEWGSLTQFEVPGWPHELIGGQAVPPRRTLQ
jgi:hypothetical protein